METRPQSLDDMPWLRYPTFYFVFLVLVGGVAFFYSLLVHSPIAG